jgi:endonuclease
MRTRKAHFILTPTPDGVLTQSMKEWLRQHPEHIPEGLDPTESTSHQLRLALKRKGWTLQETDTEFRLLPPGSSAEASPVLNEMLEEGTEGGEDPEEAAFGLEHQLRDFLAQNLGAIKINGQRLTLYVSPTGEDGIEFRTAVGPIDILARDSSGAFYVFELKRGRTPDHTIGQVTRYMGWVSQTIGREKPVYGVIVAKQISNTLRYAVCVLPAVSLFEYEVSFSLRPAPPPD